MYYVAVTESYATRDTQVRESRITDTGDMPGRWVDWDNAQAFIGIYNESSQECAMAQAQADANIHPDNICLIALPEPMISSPDSTSQMGTLKERDSVLERLWAQLSDIPLDPETEVLEEPFLLFGKGTPREDVWQWFDERHSKGVAYLLYHGTEDYVTESNNLYKLQQSCFDCESSDCAFCVNGSCRFPMVHNRLPNITDYDGCTESVICAF